MIAVLVATGLMLVSRAGGRDCGGHLTRDSGIVHTPGFPHPFRLPANCRWVIDSSSRPQGTTIVVRMTQLYVTAGLTFTEFAYYEPDSPFRLGANTLYEVTETTALAVLNVTTSQHYLVIDFKMERLAGNHIRALEGLLDVYGFNLTYNIYRGKSALHSYTPACSVAACSMLGNCYASSDFSSYWCSCFPGFSGPQCSQGPLCQPDTNVCHNGATCRHVGAAVVSCLCPPGFTGQLCDQPLPPKGCGGTEDCTVQCRYDETREVPPCNCDTEPTPVTQDLSHYECTLRLMNLTALRDSARPLETRIQKQITRYLRGSNLSKVDEAKILNITTYNHKRVANCTYRFPSSLASCSCGTCFGTLELYCDHPQSLRQNMASKRRNMFHKNKTQETTEKGGEVHFHFLASRREGGRVRDVLSSLVEKGKLGNLTLISTHFAFKQEPTLMLKSVSVNHKEGLVRQGDSFLLSCLAQGSAGVSFRWFKDGARVNVSKATRKMKEWVGLHDSSDKITSFLEVEKAEVLDGGQFTCRALDWGYQQCKSIRIYIVQPLKVNVAPVTSTIEKGRNLTIRCSTPVKHARTKYGYNWTKNKSLFRMDTKKEFWEDLYPEGSILKIYNIQRSATYTCQVQGGVWAGEGSSQVVVVDGGPGGVLALGGGCPEEHDLRGHRWPATGAAHLARGPCPGPRYTGAATRLCLLLEPGKAKWQVPDYSACVSQQTLEIINNNMIRHSDAIFLDYPQSLKLKMASKCRNMFCLNKKQGTTKIVPQAEDGVQAPKHVQREQETGDDGNRLFPTVPCVSTGVFGQVLETALLLRQFHSLRLGYERSSVSRTVYETAAAVQAVGSAGYPGQAEPLVALLAAVLQYINDTRDWTQLVNTTNNFFATVNGLLQKNTSIINQQKIGLLQKTVGQWALLWSRHCPGTFTQLAYDSVLVDAVKVIPMQKSITIDIPNTRFNYPSWLKTKISVDVENPVEELPDGVHPAVAVVVYKDMKKFLLKQYSQKIHGGVELEFELSSEVVEVTHSGDLRVKVGLRGEGTSATGCAASDPGEDWRVTPCDAALVQPATLTCQCSDHQLYSTVKNYNMPPDKQSPTGARPSAVVMVGCSCCLVQSLLTLLLLAIRWWNRPSCILFLKMQCCTSTASAMVLFIYTSKATVPEAMYFYISVSLQFFILITLSSQLAKLVIVYSEVVKIPKVKHFRLTVVTIITGICGVCGLSSALVHKYRNSAGGDEEPPYWWIRYGTGIFNVTATYAGLVLLLYIFICTDLTLKLTSLLNKKLPTAGETIHRRTGLIKRSVAVLLGTVCMTTSSVLYANNPTIGYQCAFALASAGMGLTIIGCYIILSETTRGTPGLFAKSTILGLEEAYSSESDNSFFTKQDAEAECDSVPPKRSDEEISSCPEEIVLKPLSAPRKSVTFHSDLVTGCAVIEDSSSGSPEKEEAGIEGDAGGCKGPIPEENTPPNRRHQLVTTRLCLELGLLADPNRPPVMVCNVDIEPPGSLIEQLIEPLPAGKEHLLLANQEQPKSRQESAKSRQEQPQPVDVLNSISHDLEYLLNNGTCEEVATDLKTPL